MKQQLIEFFSGDGVSNLNFLGPFHLFNIAVTVIIAILIYKYSEKLSVSKYKDKIAKGFVLILLTNMVIYYGASVLLGYWTPQEYLPLEYCYILGFSLMYIMWFKKEKYFNMIYFCIFMCSTLVIIWHDPNLGFNGYHLYLLIVSHHILALANFYTLFVLKYNVDKTGYLKATIFSLSVYGVVALINYLIGSSYIFTSGLPDFMYDIYPFLTKENSTILLFLFGFIFAFIAFMPVNYNNRKNRLQIK